MKELSIEEKARCYDAALEKARMWKEKSGMPADRQGILNDVFPELEESEDDKVRKKLIHLVKKSHEQGGYALHKWEADEMLAWLEKPGEQKSIWHNEDEEPQRDSLILLIMQSGTPIVAKIIESNHTFNHGERWAYIDDLLEKHGEKNPIDPDTLIQQRVDALADIVAEHKPADKIEPKFYERDWIVDGIDVVYQIKEIKEDRYLLQFYNSNDVISSKISTIDNDCHLWTIKDAKDGDILCTYECDEPKIVFILKGAPKIHYALSYHCYYNIMYSYFKSDSEKGCLAPNDEDVKPATKEQRDTLMKAMTDAGYIFDFEKKELKKIEKNPAENEELTEFDKAVGVSIGTWNPKTPEQIQSVKVVSKRLLKLAKKQINDEQKPAEWSEEDDKRFSVVIAEFAKCAGKSVSKDEWMRCNDWLYSLKDRVQPQPKQEWSEEDNRILHAIRNALNYEKPRNYLKSRDLEFLEVLDWLKSLRPQNSM